MSKFSELIQKDVELNKKRLEEFTVKLGWWSLSNCDDLFLAAQRLHIAEDVLRSLADAEKKQQEEKRRLAFLYRYYQKEHRNKAQWPKRSTSITTNLADQCELSAIAEMLSKIDDYRDGII